MSHVPLKREQFNALVSTGKIEDIQSILSTLPQGDLIRFEDFEKWLYPEEGDFHERYWHYLRLFGIGGSESVYAYNMGRLVRGEMISSPNPATLIKEKLLLFVRTFDEQTQAILNRGNEFEEKIADLIVRQEGWTVAEEEMRELASVFVADKSHPWLIGNPDLLLRDKNGRLVLTDIKAPNKAYSTIPLGYACQLHHYRLKLMRVLGEDVDMYLCPYDWSKHQVRIIPLAHDPEIDSRVLEGGDALWEMVLNGQIPEISPEAFKRSAKGDIDKATFHEIEKMEHELLVLQALDKMISEKSDNLRASIIEKINHIPVKFKVDSSSLGLHIATVVAKRSVDAKVVSEVLNIPDDEIPMKKTASWDAAKMAKELKKLGYDMDQFKKTSIDVDAMERKAAQMGCTYDDLVATGAIVESVSLRIAEPNQKSPSEKYQYYAGIKEDAKQVFAALSEVVRESIEEAEGGALEDKNEGKTEMKTEMKEGDTACLPAQSSGAENAGNDEQEDSIFLTPDMAGRQNHVYSLDDDDLNAILGGDPAAHEPAVPVTSSPTMASLKSLF